MRYLFSSFVFLSVGLMAMTAAAADPGDKGDKEAKKDDGGAYAEMREKILKEFDKDGDGKLSDEEREKARDKIRELRIKIAKKNGDKPVEKGARRDGRPGPGGPPKLPKPEELFTKFDKDKDGKLSKDEFMALADFVHEHMPPPPRPMAGPPGPPGGHFEGRFEGRIEGRFIEGGPDGPRGREGAGGRFHGPDGPPRDGEGPGRFFHRPDGPPPGPGPGPRGDGPRGERRLDRDGQHGPPGDRDDDDHHGKKDKDDDEKGDQDKSVSAV
jgi:EF-hand domain pair